MRTMRHLIRERGGGHGIQGYVAGGRRGRCVARRTGGRAAGAVPLLEEREGDPREVNVLSYLIYTAVRLLEMRRVLKVAGSLWLHSTIWPVTISRC